MTRGKGYPPAPPLSTSSAVVPQSFEFPAHNRPPLPPVPPPAVFLAWNAHNVCSTSAFLGRASPAPRGTSMCALTASIGVTDMFFSSSELGSLAWQGPIQVRWQALAPHTVPGRAGPCRMWSPFYNPPQIVSPVHDWPRKLLWIPSLACFPVGQTTHMFGNKWRHGTLGNPFY